MIYLASPYTADSDAKEWERYEAALKAAAFLNLVEDEPVFSPIVYCHQMYKEGYIAGGDWNTWHKFNKAMLRISAKLYVLPLDGWQNSNGLHKELTIAFDLEIPAFEVNTEDYSVSHWMHALQ